MKHILFALILLFSTITAADTAPTKFKNPIFNTKIRGLSSFKQNLVLTPISKDDANRDEHSKCIFIQDNGTDITLECENPYYPNNNIIYQYVSEGYRSAGNACMIRQYYYSNHTDYNNGRYLGYFYFVTDPLPGNTCGASVNGDEFEKAFDDKAKR
jgi:hypothetical protein